MTSKYVEFEVLKDGPLHITLLADQRAEVEEIVADSQLSGDEKLERVIEWHLGNGWEWLLPEEISALTDAPLLSQEVERDDLNHIISLGAVYWYREYEVLDPVQELLTHGFVDFTRDIVASV